MNSQYLQDYEASLRRLAGRDQISESILRQSFESFVTLISKKVGGRAIPEGDLLQLTVHLLLISDGLSRLDEDTDDTRAAHYLVGLGFEQTSELPARDLADLHDTTPSTPLSDDIWYRLVLAFLHYSTAGYRIQARTVVGRLETVANSRIQANPNANNLYQEAIEAIHSIRDALPRQASIGTFQSRNWHSIFYGNDELPTISLQKFRRLARQVQKRRLVLLERLGYIPEEAEGWLTSRGVSCRYNPGETTESLARKL